MLRQLLVNRFWDRTHARGGIPTWTQELTVRHALNRRVTGSVGVWPVEWLAAEHVEEPFPRALSLGCGEGPLERDLRAKGLCREILGLDLSTEALERARRLAREAGLDGIAYRRADLDADLELEPGGYDAVFVHQALHHVRRLESCLDQVAAALKPGGLFYLDEYVGPSRHEWTRQLLAGAEAVYQGLPRRLRRRRRLQLPVDWRDPSEAVRSSEIVPLVEERFAVRERRGYGGNLLALIYPHLRLEGLDAAARDALLEDLLAREDALLDGGAPSFYTVLVAER